MEMAGEPADISDHDARASTPTTVLPQQQPEGRNQTRSPPDRGAAMQSFAARTEQVRRSKLASRECLGRELPTDAERFIGRPARPVPATGRATDDAVPGTEATG